MTIGYLKNPRRTPTPNRYREPFKPSPRAVLAQRAMALNVCAPPPEVVAALQAISVHDELSRHFERGKPATTAAPIRSAEGPHEPKVGETWRHSNGRAFLITALRDGRVLGRDPEGREKGLSIIYAAAHDDWSRLTPAPQPTWREATEPRAMLKAAGFVQIDGEDWKHATRGSCVRVWPPEGNKRERYLWAPDVNTEMAFVATLIEAIAHALSEPTP